MKRLLFITLALIFICSPSVFATCSNSLDSFATEVIINKPDTTYNVNILGNIKNVENVDGKYIMQSSYDPSLALVLEDQSGLTTGKTSGLSVRLQIPVKAEEKQFPYLKLISSINKGKLNVSSSYYNGWDISCMKGIPTPQCEFKKEQTTLLVSLVSPNRYEVILENTDDLKKCSSCDGACVGLGETRCLDKRLKTSIEEILVYSGVITSFSDFLSSYRIATMGSIAQTDLSPQVSPDEIDWKAAISQELTKLRSLNIISLTTSDIAEISILAEQGTAGHNSRIIYGEDTTDHERWTYYSQTKFCEASKLVNCQDFPISLIPLGEASFESPKISTYWLVPLVITGSLLVIFFLLVLTARLIDTTRHHKPKAITGLRAN